MKRLTLGVMSQTPHRCSFCLKPEVEVAKIVAGPGSFICNECVDLCVQILAGPSQPAGGRTEPDVPSWSAMPDEALLGRLPLIAESADQVEAALEEWVAEARRREASWARIGAALGMTRQAAWERFAHTG